MKLLNNKFYYDNKKEIEILAILATITGLFLQIDVNQTSLRMIQLLLLTILGFYLIYFCSLLFFRFVITNPNNTLWDILGEGFAIFSIFFTYNIALFIWQEYRPEINSIWPILCLWLFIQSYISTDSIRNTFKNNDNKQRLFIVIANIILIGSGIVFTLSNTDFTTSDVLQNPKIYSNLSVFILFGINKMLYDLGFYTSKKLYYFILAMIFISLVSSIIMGFLIKSVYL